jgi:hypothetical protein
MVDALPNCGSTNQMLPSELKATLSHRTTFKPRAFTTGWALQAASLIDTHCPSQPHSHRQRLQAAGDLRHAGRPPAHVSR